MKTITLAAIALIALAAAPDPATAADAPSPRITVSGQGNVDRLPDQAVVSFGIVTNDDNATRATSANNTLYNGLVARMHALGIDPSAIKTTGYDVSNNPRPPKPNPQFPQRFGYVVTRTISVSSNRIDQAGAIVDAAVAAGVSNVNGIAFGLRDSRAAYRAALASAVSDAEAQAQALASAAHVRIVRIASITAGSGSIPRPIPQFSRMAETMAAVPTDVPPGNLSIAATATVTYEISQ